MRSLSPCQTDPLRYLNWHLCFPELGLATAATLLEVEQLRQPGVVERPVQIANRRVLAVFGLGLTLLPVLRP